MTTLGEVPYNITDLTGQNLSLNDLGIANHYLPDNQICAQITVKWNHATISPETLALFFSLHFMAIIFHEWGHILALKYYYRKENILAKFGLVNNRPKIWTGSEWHFASLQPKEKINIYLAGIAMGLIPIFAGILINPFIMLNLPFYAWGCIQDVKLIRLNILGEEGVKKQNEKIKDWFNGLFQKATKKH